MFTDEELVEKIKKGDGEAENELFSRYKEMVTKISRSYFLIGGDVEDIIQEGMIGLYKAVHGYNNQKAATFKTYAVVCIKHQIQTAIKKANALKNNPLSSAVSFQKFSGSNETVEFLPVELVLSESPDEQVINKENFENLQKTIKQTLSPLEMKVLAAYLQGYSYREIAENLGKSRKAIDNCLSRIKIKLKTSTMKQDYIEKND